MWEAKWPVGTHRFGDVKHQNVYLLRKMPCFDGICQFLPKNKADDISASVVYSSARISVYSTSCQIEVLGMYRPCQGVPASRDSAFITRLPTALIHTLLAVGKYTCPRSGYVTDVWFLKRTESISCQRFWRRKNCVRTHHGVIYTKDPFLILSLLIVKIQWL